MRIRSLILACLLTSGASPLLAEIACEDKVNRFLGTFPEGSGELLYGLPLDEVMADPNGALELISLANSATLIELLTAVPASSLVDPVNGEMLVLTHDLLECGDFFGWGDEQAEYLQNLQDYRLETMNTILVEYIAMNSEDAG